MNSLDSIIIVLAIAFGIYKFYELSVRSRERKDIIEKMNFADGAVLSVDVSRWLPPPVKTFGALRVGLILIGIGLGMCIAFIANFYMNTPHREGSGEILYFALMLFFGGVGLVIGHIMERKTKKD
jgi:hypothetical protein